MSILNQEITEIAQETIEAKSTDFQSLESFTLKLSDRTLEKGDTLKVGVYGDSAISSFSNVVNNYESPDGCSLQYLDLELSKHLKSTFRISEQTKRANLEQYISAGIDAILDGLETFLFSLISATNFPGEISIPTFEKDKIADIWANEQVSKMGSKKMILNNFFYSSLLDSEGLSHYSKANTDQTLRAAKVEKINGFEIYPSNNLQSINGFVTDNTGLAVGLSLPAFQDSETTKNIFATKITSQNGVSMQIRKHQDNKTGSFFGTVELLTGCRVLDNQGLLRIT